MNKEDVKQLPAKALIKIIQKNGSVAATWITSQPVLMLGEILSFHTPDDLADSETTIEISFHTPFTLAKS